MDGGEESRDTTLDLIGQVALDRGSAEALRLVLNNRQLALRVVARKDGWWIEYRVEWESPMKIVEAWRLWARFSEKDVAVAKCVECVLKNQASRFEVDE